MRVARKLTESRTPRWCLKLKYQVAGKLYIKNTTTNNFLHLELIQIYLEEVKMYWDLILTGNVPPTSHRKQS